MIDESFNINTKRFCDIPGDVHDFMNEAVKPAVDEQTYFKNAVAHGIHLDLKHEMFKAQEDYRSTYHMLLTILNDLDSQRVTGEPIKDEDIEFLTENIDEYKKKLLKAAKIRKLKDDFESRYNNYIGGYECE